MSEPEQKDKAEDESQRDITKTPEYRKFRRLLKQVIKAPPMRRLSNKVHKPR
jgi:hypothetical protein